MDRKYLEEHLSAYLDNELEPKKLREFEQALKAHPDLQEQIARLQRLNQFARDSEVPMPAEGYFDNLAERIEARIEREHPRERGKIVDFLLARRKMVAIISSVAAVLLITVISVEFYGPEREMYPRQFQKTIEIKSDTAKPPVPAAMPKTEGQEDESRMLVKPPAVYGDTARGELRTKAIPEADVAAKDAIIQDELLLKSSPQGVQPAAPTALDAAERANLSSVKPVDQAATKEATTAPSQEQLVQDTTRRIAVDTIEVESSERARTRPIVDVESSAESRKLQPKKLEKSNAAKQPLTASGESTMDAFAPSLSREGHMSIENSKFVWPVGTADYFETILHHAIDNLNWEAIEVWPAVRIGSIPADRDSQLTERWQAHYESKVSVEPELWYAERAFLTALEDEFSEQSCVYARVLISHYLKTSQIPDRDLWEARLDSVRIAETKYR